MPASVRTGLRPDPAGGGLRETGNAAVTRVAWSVAALVLVCGLAACSPDPPAGADTAADAGSQALRVETAQPPPLPEPAPVPPAPTQDLAQELAPAQGYVGNARAQGIEGQWAGEALACNSGEAIRFTATGFMTEGETGTWQLAGDVLSIRMEPVSGGDAVETNLTLVAVTDSQLVWRDFAGQERSFVRCPP